VQPFKTAKACAVASFERSYIGRLLEKAGGNVSLAARISHKERSALNKLARKYGLSGERFRDSSGYSTSRS
jgi:transcriptional regulator with GAF, ATPase, and Fis domain